MAPSDRDSVSIGELIESGVIIAHKDGNHGSNYPRASEFSDEGVLFLTAKLLDGAGNIDFKSAPRLNHEKAAKIKFGYLETGDVLLSHNATVGRAALVPQLEEPVLIGTSLTHFRLDASQLLPRYLALYFQGQDFQNELAAFMSQTTRNQVPITAQRKLKVVVPPLREQEGVAHILGTLDDKIELNRQMNATLESMAQALFKSWFVDFDPVIDNALTAGNPIPEPLQARAEMRAALGDKRKPLPETIQQQFPDRFVFSEGMGWVPEGWLVNAIYNIANFVNGAAFKSEQFSPDLTGSPVIKIAELKNGISSQTKFTSEKLDKRYEINAGDMLFSWSGNPDTSIDTFIWTLEPGWLNQHIFKVETLTSTDRMFVYYLLKYLKPTFAEIARDKQTTGLGHITVKDLKRTFVAIPGEGLSEHFRSFSEPIFLRWYGNLIELNQLVLIRDTLLPKLLSGELRIPEAEKQVAEAV